MIKVMLVEDHPEYREAIRLALEGASDIELIAQVGIAERGLAILQDRAQHITPDVILLDLNLPGKSGLDSLPDFRSASPDTKVIVLTQSQQEASVVRAIQSGASGYLLKSSTVAQIMDGIRTVASGGAILGSGVAKFILSALHDRTPSEELEDALSNREIEVLSMLGKGLLKKEIACELGISAATVATYIRRIYEKLDVQNAPSAVSKAYRTGVLPHDSPENDRKQ